MTRRLLLAALAPPIVALGCAARTNNRSLPPDHPANPEAAAAPAPQYSQTLAVESRPQPAAPQASPQPPAPAEGGHHAHH